MFSTTETVRDFYGKVIFFSYEDFMSLIVNGNCCFICGSNPEEKPFNNEHIIPKWLLRKYNLFDKAITIPNNETINYSRYVVPCCGECNQFLGDNIETPVKVILENLLENEKTGERLLTEFTSENIKLLTIWLNLIYLKTHLKDTNLREKLDMRENPKSIFSTYERFMEDLHHVHCVARSIYTGFDISPNALGSISFINLENTNGIDQYGYGDNISFTMFIRLERIGIIHVLNDAAAVGSVMANWLNEIQGNINEIGIFQFRELYARYCYMNILIKNRPDFHSKFKYSERRLIEADRDDEILLDDEIPNILGVYIQHSLLDFSELIDLTDGEGSFNNLGTGEYSYLINNNNND